ncbi:MAG: DNA cytosine methyltransferase [Bifidobacteriaceae bacterium]|jgi:DNA (cytosine-5)-methyltransferase 1|nr:DNA cytosine methyltransferase [Bifidobacteriaceae bacterium]
MRDQDQAGPQPGARRRTAASLFSGYGGLDLAVEEVFNARTVWFSENSEAVARVFAARWPGVPNLGDITKIDWASVPRVDVLAGGVPCQSVSSGGRRGGPASPDTATGLWAHMYEAIRVPQPEWIVIENVRGLLHARAQRPTDERDRYERLSASGNGVDAVRGVEPGVGGLGDVATGSLRAAGAFMCPALEC